MPKLPLLSGKEAISILTKYFGFIFVSQKGSHVKLQKRMMNRTITTIVPDHTELARGTLRGILGLAEVKEEDFFRSIEK